MMEPAPDPRRLPARQTCLFLDVDGTLLHFGARPDDVHVDDELLLLLTRLQAYLGGALALVSGRPLAQIDRLFAPLRLPAAGLHGFERRCSAQRLHRPTLPAERLDAARAALQAATRLDLGIELEDKGVALALHYRGAPAAADEARALMQQVAAPLAPEFELLEGACVLELKPAAANKAIAIEAFMQEEPFAGRTPVYIGDDRTDFDGFGAVRRHAGLDIAVGDRVPARWRLPDPAAVRDWLLRLASPEPVA